MQLCECGCGQEVKSGNRFIHGHNQKGKMNISARRSGSDHPSYKHGISAKEKKWRDAVLQRDDYICQRCHKNKELKRLDAHHIKPREQFPELIYDINNGITLCVSCHTAIHKIGNKYNKGRTSWNKEKKLSIEHRMKISESNKGHKHSEETKKKISKNNKGRVPWNKGMPASEEQKQKQALSMKGRKHSEETKRKISNANKGKHTLSQEQKLKLSKLHKGTKLSEETKRKISKTLKGNKISEETRKKISEAIKARWKEKKNE